MAKVDVRLQRQLVVLDHGKEVELHVLVVVSVLELVDLVQILDIVMDLVDIVGDIILVIQVHYYVFLIRDFHMCAANKK